MDAHDLLTRIPHIIDSDAIRDVDAVVQYLVERPLWFEVAGGEVTVHDGHAAAPNVTVQAPDTLLIELFYGRADALMAFMMGRLKVRGDMPLAQRLLQAVDRDRLEENGPQSR